MHVQIASNIQLTDEELSAALAAIACCLSDDAPATETRAGDWQWRVTSALITQGLVELRAPIKPSWGHVERLRRAGHGTVGIVGL